MEIGVTFPQNGVGGDIGAIREYVQTAEALGYDYIFAGDHVIGGDPDGLDGRAGAVHGRLHLPRADDAARLHGGDHDAHQVLHRRDHPAAAPGDAGGQAGGGDRLPQRRAPHARRRRRLERARVRGAERRLPHARRAHGRAVRGHAARCGRNERPAIEGRWHHIDRSGLNPRPCTADPAVDRRRSRCRAQAHRAASPTAGSP